MQTPIDRRRFLKLSAFSTLALLTPKIGFASVDPPGAEERSLVFYNPNTRERLSAVYWSNGCYRASALEKINYIMRDYHTGEITPIDVRLLDLLHELKAESGRHCPIRVISGYRTHQTNELLRRQGFCAAKNSYHMRGMAVDFDLPGTDLHHLFQMAADKQAGGVGYYPHHSFIHIDVGPVRYWRGSA
jgi:uncharacterized protein YcbK (DUF882 family)